MFKRELKFNLRSFIVWTLITLGIFLVVFLVYPSIASSDNITMMDEMMKMFPSEMLKAFNMDISAMDTVYGWLKTEGFVFVLLIIGCYSGITGTSILLKEENDKTIEYLNSLPVKRNDIIIKKALVGVLYIVMLVLVLGVFNYIGLTLSGDFDKKQYLLLSITPLFPSLLIFFICMFISTFTHKTKKMIGISLGFVLISYILQTLSSLSKQVEFLKYFSVFTLADLRNVITNVEFSSVIIVLTLLLSLAFLVLTKINYNKKELV